MGILPEPFESSAAPRPAQASPTPLKPPTALTPLISAAPPAPLTTRISSKKIIKEKNWDVSPTFRHLTHLESTNRFQKSRKGTPNYVALMPHNPFKMNTRRAHLQRVRTHTLTASFHESCFTYDPPSAVHRPPFTVHPPSTVHRPPSSHPPVVRPPALDPLFDLLAV